MSVPMTRMADDAIPHGQQPGAFSWRNMNGERYLLVACACGNDHVISVPVGPSAVAERQHGSDHTGGPVWEWDGNEDAPTIMPSVRVIGGCRWHGYVRAGQLDGWFEAAP